MSKKTLLTLFFCVVAAVFAAMLVNIGINKPNASAAIGSYLFEKSNEKGTEISKIVLEIKGLKITLHYQDKFWRVTEADDYFADLLAVNNLVQSINNAKIEIAAEEKNFAEPAQSIKIKTYAGEELLDDVTIGKKQNNFYYAQKANNPNVYLVSGDFDLPKKLQYWLQHPLISLESKNIESLVQISTSGKQFAFNPYRKDIFYDINNNKVDIKDLTNQFSWLSYKNVKRTANFLSQDEKPQKTIILKIATGLIYDLRLYKISENYWLTVKISADKLPTKAVAAYVKDSAVFYNDWLFEIDNKVGNFLSSYQIR